MATTHRFLGIDNDIDLVLQWFENTGLPIQTSDRADAVVIHFFKTGPIVEGADGQILQDRSPLVWVIRPSRIRRSLWTSGEVIFTPTLLRFPEMNRIHRRFGSWLRGFPIVYSNKKPEDFEWAYFLEGSLKNWDSPLFALPTASDKLRGGQYFVHHGDKGDFLNRICRQLRLRGVDVDVNE
jgi:hypothetical protein